MKLDKPKTINYVLWIAFILAMLSSVQHIAWTFGTVERPGTEWLGWIPAIAVDAGLAALAYTIQQRRRAKRPVGWLWAGVVIFAVISALANLYHALAVEIGGTATLSEIVAVDLLQLGKAIFLSATLPALVIYLSEIVSSDDAAAADQERRAAEREQAKAEREARKSELEAQARLLEAENEAKKLVSPQLQSEPEQILCGDCGRSFRSINARNAHKCEHKNGKAEPTAISEVMQ